MRKTAGRHRAGHARPAGSPGTIEPEANAPEANAPEPGEAEPGEARATDPESADPESADPESADPAERTDAALLTEVRGGDTAAFGVLYDRHREAARRLARALVRDPSDAEDLVAEAVAKVLTALRAGRGPEVAFRAYLLTAVRNVCYDRARRDRRIELTGDLTPYEGAAGERSAGSGWTESITMTRLEHSYAARAFAKLPERWQMVLWHTEVEGEKPATIAVMLGLSPNAVAALAYRARERLRQIYLQEHLATTGEPSCHWTADRLGAHVRGGLPRRDRSKVDAHLADCADCRALWLELTEVNAGLRGVLAPVVLGTAATPYLATMPPLTWWGALAGLGQAMLEAVRDAWAALVGWVQGLVQRYGPNNVAAGVGITAAALAGIGLFVVALALGPDRPDPQPPPAADGPRLPEPAPVPPEDEPPTESPVDPAPTEPGGTTAAAEQPAGVPGPPARPSEPPGRPSPPPADPVQVAPDLTTTALAAGDQGALAIEVALPGGGGGGAPAPPPTGAIVEFSGNTPGDTPARATKLHDRREREAGRVLLEVAWPAGLALAAEDAGNGWRCTAGSAPGASCQRPAWPAGESRTARVPVTVDRALGGFAPIEVTVAAGALRGEAGFRVPVTPVGQRLGYAASGPYGLAMAGNTWLTCRDAPQCQGGDNNRVPLRPYRPGYGDPTPPPDLADLPAASGAALALPAGAEVAWAGLHWATTSQDGPATAVLHGPSGGPHPITPDSVVHGDGPPLRQAYADVTGAVRGGGAGEWWVAPLDGALPTGRGVSAGWSLTVAFRHPDQPRRDLAIFADPVWLPEGGQRSLSAAAAEGEEVDVGVALWEGDRTLTGDSLRLDGEPLGDPENVAASRAAGALECPRGAGAGCDWHTYGVDVARYRGTGTDGGAVTLRTQADKLVVGVVALAVEAPR